MRLHSRLTVDEQKETSVIHIFHKYVPYEPVAPQIQRLHVGGKIYKPHAWTFHAVLYVSGSILDLDYTNSPKIENAEMYFKNMWPQDRLFEDYRFQIKPANLYTSVDSNGRMDEEIYPNLTFEELKSVLFLK